MELLTIQEVAEQCYTSKNNIRNYIRRLNLQLLTVKKDGGGLSLFAKRREYSESTQKKKYC